MVCGGIGAVALAWWTQPAVTPPPALTFTIVAPLAAALVAAFVETIPVRLDDNISVPAAAAAVLWLASLMDRAAFDAARGAAIAALPWAIGINTLAAYLGYRAKTVSRAGAIAGALVGIVIYCGGGGGAWVLLFVTFLAASITSRLGLTRKVTLHGAVPEEMRDKFLLHSLPGALAIRLVIERPDQRSHQQQDRNQDNAAR